MTGRVNQTGDWQTGEMPSRASLFLSLSLPRSRWRPTPSTFTSCTLSQFNPCAFLSFPDDSPSSFVIHLTFVQNSVCPSRLDSRYIVFLLASSGEISSLSVLRIPFSFLSRCLVPSSSFVHLRRAPTFSLISLSRNSLAENDPSSFLAAVSLPFEAPRHAFPSLIHLLDFSTPSHFLHHIHPSVFPARHLLPHFQIPSLLQHPSGCSTLFSDSHQLFLDAALPTELRNALPYPRRGTIRGTCVRSTSIDLFQLTYAPARPDLLYRFYTFCAYGCVHTTHRRRGEMKRKADKGKKL